MIPEVILGLILLGFLLQTVPSSSLLPAFLFQQSMAAWLSSGSSNSVVELERFPLGFKPLRIAQLMSNRNTLMEHYQLRADCMAFTHLPSLTVLNTFFPCKNLLPTRVYSTVLPSVDGLLFGTFCDLQFSVSK